MTRAGREPAEDVKRRLVAACQEVGLEINSASMHLSKEHGARWILVEAAPPDWPHELSPLSVMARVGIAGEWPKSVDIRCLGSRENPTRVTGPWMKGRHEVPLENLIEQLQATLEERKQVLELADSGDPGPYTFEASVWQNVDLLDGLNPF